MKIFLAGGTGSIDPYAVLKLEIPGQEVTILARNKNKVSVLINNSDLDTGVK
ncbi:MAG: hypothetical protein JEY94_06240 [Melioribacteraceae bacterium]|nr:hypothetical protein [Melioribacteraceae bacterium]